jgi:hypothetical protein
MSEGVEERLFELEMAMSVAHDRLGECEAEIAALKALGELQRKTNQVTTEAQEQMLAFIRNLTGRGPN